MYPKDTYPTRQAGVRRRVIVIEETLPAASAPEQEVVAFRLRLALRSGEAISESIAC